MGRSIYEGFTVGYALALSQFVMAWGLGWGYLRKADRDFDPLLVLGKVGFNPDRAVRPPHTARRGRSPSSTCARRRASAPSAPSPGSDQRSAMNSDCAASPIWPRSSLSVEYARPAPWGSRRVSASSCTHSVAGSRWRWTVRSVFTNR